MKLSNCPLCQKQFPIYLARCKRCGTVFCDACMEAAAQTEGKLTVGPGPIAVIGFVCPSCRSTEIDFPD
ncbi:hypothetical protein DesfrDRAFT_0829 [Solidesulfovibrio fructosivorans JJ]]|uniref:RING-type domain-containing protein n=1 Tax=Solidesulfovibrio fructosivorans JJ] TaxID=596151 RepID=E1JT80_SOLFR|nr:hypothetical protein DesfrDRAFT_0829 [Solidesulfovibrio fructosivorans JJ]]